MDDSTENVTILAETFIGVFKIFNDSKLIHKRLYQITEGYDLTDPANKIPIAVFNEMCTWIEKNVGKSSLIKMGIQIGESAFAIMHKGSMIDNGTPLDLMKSLVLIAKKGIIDPKKRGWEIVEFGENEIIMRRTQTFNSSMQLGVLRGIVQKSDMEFVRVTFHKEISQGADYDEYLIKWL